MIWPERLPARDLIVIEARLFIHHAFQPCNLLFSDRDTEPPACGHHRASSVPVVCACAIALRDLVTETSADAEHLRQALSGVGTVGCLALLHRHEHGYRHIHTALRFALSGDEQGLGSRGAEPCFPAPPPAPALRFPALPPPWAALMLPSAGPRGAHTARSDRPCGTTTDGPDPAPTRRSAVASAHPKPGYQRGQARACHFHRLRVGPSIFFSGGRIVAK